MAKKIRNFILLITIGLAACKKSPEYLIGKWQILNLVENDKSVDLIENWMHLKANGTFNSYDGTLKKSESGTWSYQLKEKMIVIDGEGKDGDSQWVLSTRNDTLFFHSTSDNLYLIAKRVNN